MNSESMSPDPLLEADVSTFKWTPEIEKYVLLHMVNLKPFGVMKFMNISNIQENIRNQHKISIPFTCMMEYLNSRWNMEAAIFNYTLYNTVDHLIHLSSVDSKDDLNKIGTSSTKVSEIEHETIPSIRRSLRTYDKHDEKELQDSTKKTNILPQMNNKTSIKNKATDSNQTKKKKIQNQSNDLKKNYAVSIVKRKKISKQFSNINIQVELEHYIPEMLKKPIIELKSKRLVHNKNKLKQVKNKTHGRLTSNLMIVQQFAVIQPLGRRSCSNNTSS